MVEEKRAAVEPERGEKESCRAVVLCRGQQLAQVQLQGSDDAEPRALMTSRDEEQRGPPLELELELELELHSLGSRLAAVARHHIIGGAASPPPQG